MAKQLSVQEATTILEEWQRSFAKAQNMTDWWAHFTPTYCEFHPIYPALIESRMFDKFQGARYQEPPRQAAGPRVSAEETIIRTYGDSAIVSVSANEVARLDKDGAITYHITRTTTVHVKVDGKWRQTAGHYGPPGNDPPFDHNEYTKGDLQYSK